MSIEEKKCESRDVTARLHYGHENGERPHLYMYNQSKHPQYKGGAATETVTIYDARQLSMTLPNNGCQLINHPTSLKNEDFYSDDESIITGKYYEEIYAAVKKITGCKHVVAFNHIVRNEKKAAKDLLNKFGLQAKVSGYAQGIHTDSSAYSANATFKHFGSKFDDNELHGKFMIINAWRSISDTAPVRNYPLALLDCTSVAAPDDYILKNLHYKDFSVTQYSLDNTNKHLHRWVYYPDMTKDELILFTQYDSDTKAHARQTFHTAFKDPTAPAEAPVRESIEVRLLCLFPEHEPNTCPVAESKSGSSAENSYEAIMDSLKAGHMWPTAAKLWMRFLVGKPMKAMRGVVKGCVDKGYHGLGGASEEFQKSVLALLEENKDEVNRLMLENFGAKLTKAEVLGNIANYVYTSSLSTFVVGSLMGAIIMSLVKNFR